MRFIELIDTGSSNNWDAHGDMADHVPLAKNVDQPIAGLIQDLKRRGMLDDTLVVWTTEFGRTPGHGQADARAASHHPASSRPGWPAAASRAASSTARPTSIGIDRRREPVHVHDFHATILHLLGLDHEKLTYRHAGRDYRLTDVSWQRRQRDPGLKADSPPFSSAVRQAPPKYGRLALFLAGADPYKINAYSQSVMFRGVAA